MSEARSVGSEEDNSMVRQDVVVTEHKVVDVRATGRTPEAVSEEVQNVLNALQADGWMLTRVEPIVYNSSTTGYLLLFFSRGATTEEFEH